jgi:lysophospholipase L1-like esterase
MPQKNILCYGDSNTHGTIPWEGINQRYDENQRWTRLLENNLGENYRVFEEGLPSRTIDLDDGKYVSLNGFATFGAILYSHLPLDWIIINLGTNDTKTKFNQSPIKMIEGIQKYLDLIDRYSSNSKILLIAPAPVNENIANNSYTPNSWVGACDKAQKFAVLLEKLALEKQIHFLDLGQVVEVSKIDGIHFDLDSQQKICHSLSGILN